MRFFLLIALVLAFPLSAHAACEGFNNALSALESAVKQPHPPQNSRMVSTETPPIASINQSLDALERAIENDRRAKSAQTPRRAPAPRPHSL